MDETSNVEKRTFDLQPDQAQYIDGLVASGTFASASEVVHAGLRALRESDAVVERWLRHAVVPIYDKMKADPGRARPLSDVRERLRAKHLARLRDEAR